MKGAGEEHQILCYNIKYEEIQPNINQIQYKILSSNQHQGLCLPNQSCLSTFNDKMRTQNQKGTKAECKKLFHLFCCFVKFL